MFPVSRTKVYGIQKRYYHPPEAKDKRTNLPGKSLDRESWSAARM